MYFHNSHNLSYSQHPQDPQSSHFPIQRLVSCHKVTTSITTLFIFVSVIFFFPFVFRFFIRKLEIYKNSNNTGMSHSYLHESDPTIVPTLIHMCKHFPKLTFNPIHTIALLSYCKESLLFFFQALLGYHQRNKFYYRLKWGAQKDNNKRIGFLAIGFTINK